MAVKAQSKTVPSSINATAEVIPSIKTKIKKKLIQKKTLKKRNSATIRINDKSDKITRILLTPVGKLGHTPVRITDNTKADPTARIATQASVGVTLLSPFRLPIPQDNLISGVARFAGLAFTIAGAIFTIINLPSASGVAHLQSPSSIQQLSALLASNSLTTTTTSGDAPSGVTSIGTETNSVPRISVEGDSPITGRSSISITVNNASEVKVIAYFTAINQSIVLGSATMIDASTWRYVWDTQNNTNGEYRIKVLVKNTFGSYDYLDSNTYTVLNQPTSDATAETHSDDDDEESTDATTESIITIDTSTSTSQETSDIQTVVSTTTPTDAITSAFVKLSLPTQKQLSGSITIRGSAHEASEFKIYAHNTTLNTQYYLGIAEHTSGDNWRITWNTTKYPNGIYKLQSIAKVDGVFYNSTFIETEVRNEIVTKVATTTTLTDDAPEETLTPEQLKPNISLKLSKENPLSNSVDLSIKTSGVHWIEVYVQPINSLTPFFLGLAQKVSNSEWRYNWSTKQTPNGTYNLYVRVKNSFGFTEGDRVNVQVRNDSLAKLTETQESHISTLRSASDALTKEVDESESDGNHEDVSLEETKTIYIQPVDDFIDSIDTEKDVQNQISTLLNEYRRKLSLKLGELSRARRNSDNDSILQIKDEIKEMRNQVLLELPPGVERKEIVDNINTYLSQITLELQELTINNETILQERVGDAIHKDSDSDGITDYDELHIYQTSPFTADTDGDNYIDSAEIKLGFDPKDSKTETLVVYESPQDTGVVREDILLVESVTTLTDDSREAEQKLEKPAKAMISGKGLPNSFVTIYIYSTPIVVTVKTDGEGSWNYIFDKELDEGVHEVYVGMTDNAGRIVAKSNPLSFVKTAEAFTQGSVVTKVIPEATTEPSLLESRAMFLVASITIVAIGLVLILLGLHVRDRRIIVQEVAQV